MIYVNNKKDEYNEKNKNRKKSPKQGIDDDGACNSPI